MKKRQPTLWPLSLLFFMVNSVVFAQYSTTQGTDFWLSFGKNAGYKGSTPITLQLKIAAFNTTSATITFTNTGASQVVSIAAGTVFTKDLTKEEIFNAYSDKPGISKKSIRIRTSELVSVYAFNQAFEITDATNVLPIKTIGTDYYHISYQAPKVEDGYTCVATEPNTSVYENSVLRAVLQKGEVYSNYFLNGDTTRHITSNKPIAYFTTCTGTYIPENVGYGDYLYQQLPPVNKWGTMFLVPVTMRGTERIRIMASQDGTQILQTGGILKSGSLTLNKGQFAELEISLNNAGCHISSNHPVGVCSYLVGFDYPGLLYRPGDPGMAWIAPLEQTLEKVVISPFIPIGLSKLVEHFALIIAPTASKGQTTMAVGTGTPSPLPLAKWTDNAASSYSFCSVELSNQNAAYCFTNPDGLLALGYGLGICESYYYWAGSAIRNLDAAFYVNEIHYEDFMNAVYCESDSVYKFEAKLHNAMSGTPGYLKWYINGAEEAAYRDSLVWQKIMHPGNYVVNMVVMDMAGESDTASTSFSIRRYVTPELAIAAKPDTVVCRGDPVTFAAVPVHGGPHPSYQWKKNNAPVGDNSAAYYDEGLADGDVISCVLVSDEKCLLTNTATGFVRMTVFDTPAEPVIVASDELPFYYGRDYTLQIQNPENGVHYDWYKNNNATGVSGNRYLLPDIGAKDAGVYFAKAVNSHQCKTNSAPFTVKAETPLVTIPNVITPNNDGINDFFYITGLSTNPFENELVIVNKRGVTVYSKKKYDNSWNADGQPDDIYYYRLKLVDAEGNTTYHKGYVQVKRK